MVRKQNQNKNMADGAPESYTSAPSASQNPLARKLKKILETRLDNDKELVDALKALSTFFGENTLRARRNLRGDVERRSLDISEKFESQFRDVKQKLDEISNDVQAMNNCCQEMTERLKNSKDSTAELIDKTTKLQNERKQLELQSTLAEAFLERYQLKSQEVRALRVSKDSIVTEDFFNALARAKQIHRDCKMLLRSKQQTAGNATHSNDEDFLENIFSACLPALNKNCKRLNPLEMESIEIDGKALQETALSAIRINTAHKCFLVYFVDVVGALLEIMESMALYQETAYEKLYRWTQEECRGMTGDIPDVSGGLCRAIEALQDRQVLLRYTFDELSAARRTAVVRCFIDALTRGGSGGTPRPIELYSHDPVRYVGDILAWLHQAVAGEKELLHSLLRRTKMTDHKPMILEILSHIMDGVCRPFKVRVEQVITSETEAPTLFRLGNILKFYEDTLKTIFESDAVTMVSSIEEMRHLSHQMFFNSLSCYGSKLAEKIDIPPPDLSPSQTVHTTMQLLKDVLSSHDSAITPLSERQQDYIKIFSCLLDPLVQCCVFAASRLNAADMATYMINCLYQMQVTLAVYEFTDVKLEMLAAQNDAHTDTLTNEQASFILSRSGLGNIYTPLKENENKKISPSAHGIDEQLIKSSMTKFDQYLSHPDSLNMPQLELIRSTRIRDTIRKRAVDLVKVSFSKVYTEIVDAKNNFENPQALIGRTPEQINQLLS